jgi:hypothetical protein
LATDTIEPSIVIVIALHCKVVCIYIGLVMIIMTIMVNNIDYMDDDHNKILIIIVIIVMMITMMMIIQ